MRRHLIQYCNTTTELWSHDDHIGRQLSSGFFYELHMLEFIKTRGYNKPVVDVGANIGNHSVYFAKHCDLLVRAFEPVDSNYKLLDLNVQKNGLMGKIITNKMGISDRKGSMGVVTVPDNMGMCQLIKGKGVMVNSLDNLLRGLDVDMLKMDCEGMEEKALAGARELITRCKPDIFIEAKTPAEENIIDKILLPLGYRRLQRFNRTPTWFYSTKD